MIRILKPTCTWAEAQQPLPAAISDALSPLDNLEGLQVFNTSVGALPQAKLVELRLPLKYAVNPSTWNAGDRVISTLSYPFQYGPVETLEDLWRNTPAFRDSYASPMDMLTALFQAVTKRPADIKFPPDGSVIDLGEGYQGRSTPFGPQIWPKQ